MSRFVRLLLISFLVAFMSHAVAQAPAEESPSEPPAAEPAEPPGPADMLGRGTPRGSIAGFIDAVDSQNFSQAAEYLDLRNLPSSVSSIGGEELARQLNHVIARAVWTRENISDDPEGEKGDGLPSYRDRIVDIELEGMEITMYMQRVPREDGELIWKISNRTVAVIPALYDEYSYDPIVERIRQSFPEDSAFLGFELWKWVILLGVSALSGILFYLLALIALRFISRPGDSAYELWRKVLTGPLVVIGILLVATQVIMYLGAGALARDVFSTRTIDTVVVVWAIWSILNLVKAHRQQKFEAAGRPSAARVLEPITAFAKITVLIFGVLFWLSNIGVNITTVLAGLGVGGLAVALALQKPIEDVMGALTIFTQIPFRVGDTVKYENHFGTIEEISLRKTRIRTLTNTVVHVPNARIAHVEVENYTNRTKIRYWPTLRLRYDTTTEQVEAVTRNIRAMLEAHENVYDEPIRVLMTDFADDAILVKVHAFLRTTDFTEFLTMAQELNLRIMKIAEAEGVRFALPGRALHMEPQ